MPLERAIGHMRQSCRFSSDRRDPDGNAYDPNTGMLFARVAKASVIRSGLGDKYSVLGKHHTQFGTPPWP